MKLVIDENITLAHSFFKEFAHLQMLPGRGIARDQLNDVDALLVRSITPVNSALLDGTKVRFVGSATIGTDHIDLPYLAKQGIGFANAPGVNANSVAEYVLSTLLTMTEVRAQSLEGLTLGIIGYGHVGQRVYQLMQAIGLHCLINDPPLAKLARQGCCESQVDFVDLDELLQADIITCHVPLTHKGEFPSYHLLDKRRLSKLKQNALLINTARGAVIDNAALLALLQQRPGLGVALDVWENEPTLLTELASACLLATPHIAGYSFDGKVAGTQKIHQALQQFFGIKPQQNEAQYPEPRVSCLSLNNTENSTKASLLSAAVRACYDVRDDDNRLRATFSWSVKERGRAFDQLRRTYPLRREFHTLTVKLQNEQTRLKQMFEQLGFMML